MTDRLIIDTKPADAPLKELTQDLVIEVDLFDEGYMATYRYVPQGAKTREYVAYNCFSALDRRDLITKHVQVIRDTKPRTAVIVTGKYSTGHVRHVELHPGVIKQIIDGKLGVDELLLQN
jgi:hypothetical protein